MKNNNESFSIALICSIALHLLAVYFFVFGLPALFPKLPEEQVIVFEMLPVSEKSNVPTKIKQSEKAIENEEAKKVEQSKPKVEQESKPIEKEEPVKKEEKPVEKLEKPIEQPKPLEEKKEQPTEPKIVEPKETIKAKPKTEVPEKKKENITEKKKEVPPAPKPAEKKKNTPSKSDLDALLKNLEQSSEGTNVKSNKQARSKESKELQESKGPYDDRLGLSVSEISLIQQQMFQHWNIPIGAQNVDQARVTIYISLNKDGSVQNVKIIDTICPNMSASICSALSDSALRAIRQASPFQGLDAKRYETWKEFNFDFNPKHF